MGGKSVDVNLDNIKVDINSDTNMAADINVGANINADINADVKADVNSKSDIKLDTSNIKTELVLPQPFKTDSRFAITEPIVTRSNSELGLDIRPMVMDFCFKFEFGKLPPTCIRRPYQHHFGLTLFGVEVMGLNFAGESTITIDDMHRRPQVAWGGEEARHSRPEHEFEDQIDTEDVRIRIGS